MPPDLDPVIQAILDSKRLTFEDETTIRHQIGLTKLKIPSVVPAVISTTLLASGGIIHFCGDKFIWPAGFTFSKILEKLLLAAAAVAAASLVTNELLRKSLKNEVLRFLDLLHETSSLSRRTSRWILDNEVLQRGYSVTTVSRENPIRGNVLSLKACLRLRRSAFIESRFMVFILRAVAVDLLEVISAGKAVDPLENHICLIALEEFGDSLSIVESDLEALYLSTDGFSLQATKSLIGLLDLQVSEFLKLLCSQRLNFAGFRRDFALLQRLKKARILFLEAFKRMEMEYKFETNEPMTASASLRRQSTLRGPGQPPDYLRSLELHLIAALKDLRIVLWDGDQVADELQKVAQQDRLEKLGYHVKCSSMLLDHLKLKTLCGEAQTPSTDNPDVSPTASDFEIRPIATSDDQIHVEDEIFEALVLNDAEAEHRGEPVLSELNHFQEQKLQSKMVLEEIKTLLSARSADWKERERRVRERKGMPAEDDLTNDSTPAELSYPVENQETPTYTTETIFNAGEMAKIAAAVGVRWNGTVEEQFGSEESE